MFELTKAQAQLAHVTPIAEKHGDDNKLAMALKLTLKAGNAMLEHFDSHLRGALFREVKSGEQQRLDGDNDFTAVRFPRIGVVAWDEDYNGYELDISVGAELQDPLQFVDVTLKKFRFEPIEGGSVGITFNANVHPDAAEAGALCALMGETVTLTLRSPIAPEIAQPQPDLDGIGEAPDDAIDQAAEALERAA
jgi:hypothetical protein